jgi:hypothetical protein
VQSRVGLFLCLIFKENTVKNKKEIDIWLYLKINKTCRLSDKAFRFKDNKSNLIRTTYKLVEGIRKRILKTQ